MAWWMPGWGGRGWRWWYRTTGVPGWMRCRWWRTPWTPWDFPPYSPPFRPEDELEMLEAMREDLEAELEDIKKRIEELRRELGK